jgi:hypothetical protein
MRLRKRPPPPSIGFESFGVTVEVVLGDLELETHVREILPPGWSRTTNTRDAGRFSLRRAATDGYTVTVGEETWLESGTLDVAIGLLDSQIRLHVAANAPEWIFVHAGVVADEMGALILPGRSFAGKTTLVKALIEAGATYYSDEYAVFDRQGRVHPYPRRLSVRSPDGNHVQEVDVHDLGGLPADEAADVALVAALRYRADAKWEPRPLSRGRGLAALMANAVPAQARPAETLRVLTAAVNRARVLEGDRGEAQPVARSLLDELRQAPVPDRLTSRDA